MEILPMGQEIGQESRHQPSVVQNEGNEYHMVFSSNGDDNRILYATSPDGENNWTLGPDPQQTSGAAPALITYVVVTFGVGLPGEATITTNLLVLVFIANDPSKRILCSILDLLEDPNLRGWRYLGQVGGESAHAVTVCSNWNRETLSDDAVTVYFTANDSSNRILEHKFIPLPGKIS
jgi:hypothetical protein